MRQATTDHWIHACALAWKRLCRGENGWYVLSGEAWDVAISRVAARILTREGYARQKGPIDPEWVLACEVMAKKAPCSADGLVEGHSRLRLGVKTINERARRRLALGAN